MLEQKIEPNLLYPNSRIHQTADALQTDNTSSIITIGMELEFLITKIPRSPPLPSKTSIFEAIRASMQNLFHSGGISIQTEIFPQRPNDQPDRSKFQLMEEKSCDPFHLDEATGEKIPGEVVEICTPIMRFRSWEWVVPTVFEHLTSQFDCRFNTTTGLHVHIGRGCGWDLSAAKSIAKAVIIFESALDHYHPAHRRPAENWCIHSNRHNDGLKHFAKSAVMKKLDGAGTLRELIDLISPHKFFKYNFGSLKTYGTVEFRQADAGIGVDRAVQWINLVVRFVTAAVEATPEEFERWARHECPAACCPPEVFERFGVPWVGMREQVSHIPKVEGLAFGVDEWGIAPRREREVVEEWAPEIAQTVQESVDPLTGWEVKEVSLRDNVEVGVEEGPKPPEDTPIEVTHTMIEDASHYLLSHANWVETALGLRGGD
ncbi:hypothetical protein HOY80DRAFT_957371 [Tuber brumale]|nr:hypothetical protein HOY80DRAFT_957371 [Tuber brumale]